MAEIEHFFDPNDKSHPKFESVRNEKMTLFSAQNQSNRENAVEISIGEAVEKVSWSICICLSKDEFKSYYLLFVQSGAGCK